MEKRFFLAFFITLVFFAAYSQFTSKYFPQKTSPVLEGQAEHEKAQQLNQEILATESLPGVSNEEQESTLQAVINNFLGTYSPLGGYIKTLAIDEGGDRLAFENIGFSPQDKDKKFVVRIDSDRIEFKGPQGEVKEFIFEGNSLVIKTSAELDEIVLFSNDLASNQLDQRYQEFFYSKNGIIERKAFRKIKDNAQDVVEFAGARGRYYCISLLENSYKIKWKKTKKTVHLTLPSPSKETFLYIGPQKKESLQPFGLQGVMHYGFFHVIALGIIKLLHFFYSLTHNWGVSVVAFSIIAYVVLLPLTLKSTKGMKDMKEFQAMHKREIEKIKEKYKGDSHKIHQATVEMYKKHGVNPLKGCSSGCLPMIFQIPLIWAFWGVVPRIWEFRNAGFLWVKDLSLPDRAIQLPFTLPFGLGQWLNILPILTGIIMYVQMRFTNPHVDSEQEQQQKMMAIIFPVMITWFTYALPSALLLYWFTNTMLTSFSQWKLMKAKKPA